MGDDLIVRRSDPLNCEVRLSRLAEGLLTPNDRFYIRNHFAVPEIDADRWRLRVHGRVNAPIDLSLPDVMRMHAVTTPVTLECAGNGRSFFDPPIEGEPWALGAVSTAEWKGVPLHEVLDRTGVASGASHLVFRSADTFERSLSLEDARTSQVLLAFEMNGEPLPAQHGHPLRLIVAGWYAVASVKWLTEIHVTDAPSDAYFQSQRYFYDRPGGREPIGRINVRSLITHPEEGQVIGRGDLTVEGLAWSGSKPVERVEVSAGDAGWHEAEMLGPAHRHAWRRWRLVTHVDPLGELDIRSRATDAGGDIQPAAAEWNSLGYGNNSIQTVTVLVR